jgi:hypothetical protein
MKPFLAASLFALTAIPAPANAQTAAPPGCDGLDHRDDFDFWVGEWDVYAPDGTFAGTNSIRETQSGCLIEEHWSGAQGSRGFSMNYYDPLAQAWRQVWMSASVYIDYRGGLNDDGAMELEGEIFYHSQGSRFPFRGVWTPNEDGSVTQHFTQYDAESENWNTWFTGRYVRRQTESDAHSGE